MLSQGRRRRRRGRSIRSLSATRPCGCSSEAEQPAFNRQVRVRLPAPAPWSPHRRGVVEWPQTAGFEPAHTGSNPVTPPIHQPLSSEAEQRSYKAKVDVSKSSGATNSSLSTSVAQLEERDPPKVEAGGSSPPGCATRTPRSCTLRWAICSDAGASTSVPCACTNICCSAAVTNSYTSISRNIWNNQIRCTSSNCCLTNERHVLTFNFFNLC